MAVSPTDRKRAAISAVAARYDAKIGPDPGAPSLSLHGRPVALTILTPRFRRSSPSSRAPRLRLDRVAIRVIGSLRSALEPRVPKGMTLIVTITAPIKLPSKTVAALEQYATELFGKRLPVRLSNEVHGNEICMHLLRGAHYHASRVLGFVHNRDSDPAPLLDMTAALLSSMARLRDAAKHVERWLVIAHQEVKTCGVTYFQVCTELLARSDFARVVLVDVGGKVSEISDRAD